MAKYSTIIDAILSTCNLNTISAKQIRKSLQAAVDYDITPQKVRLHAVIPDFYFTLRFDYVGTKLTVTQAAITELILERFDNFSKDKDIPTVTSPVKTEPTTHNDTTNNSVTTNSFGLTLPSRALNGDHKKPDTSTPSSNSFSPGRKRQNPTADNSNHDESLEASDAGISSPAKKPRKSKATEEDDAAFAARLQAQENSLARSTRGNNSTKRRSAVNKATPKKNKKTKSAKKIKDDDESGLETGSGVEKKEVKRTGGFHVRAFQAST